jgi:photosystem II stability/assembly factor-like uncharacterized protein
MKKLFFWISLLICFSELKLLAEWETLSGIPQVPITDLLVSKNKAFAIAWTSGIYVSSDYGDNWVQQNKGINTGFVKAITKVGDVLLVGTTDTNGVFRSTDNGFNWVRSSDSLTERNVATFAVDGEVVYLLTESSVIFKSTDFGSTWWQISTSDIDNYTISAIAVKDGKILAGTSSGDLFLSTNDGNSWTNIKNQQIYSSITYLLWDGDNIYCGTQAGVYFSSNMGTNWFQRNAGLKVQSVSIIKKINNAFLLGTKTGGVYFSLDEGRTWFEFNEGIPDMSILSITNDSYYIYIGTEYSTVARRRISEIQIPEVQAPELVYPPNGAKGVEKVVNFAWSEVKGAIGYHIVVAKDASFSINSIVLDKTGWTSTFYPSVTLQPNRKYYWKVASIDFQYQEKWSEVASFETIFDTVKPTLYFPLNNLEISKLPVQFYWSDVGIIDHYQFQLSSMEDFQSLIVDVSTLDTTYTVGQEIENNKTYYWRVIAVYNDTLSIVSDTFTFRTTTLGVENEPEQAVSFAHPESKLVIYFENTSPNEIVSVEVFDIIGKSVLFGWFETTDSKHSIELDLGKFPNGVYICHVKKNNKAWNYLFEVVK